MRSKNGKKKGIHEISLSKSTRQIASGRLEQIGPAVILKSESEESPNLPMPYEMKKILRSGFGQAGGQVRYYSHASRELKNKTLTIIAFYRPIHRNHYQK